MAPEVVHGILPTSHQPKFEVCMHEMSIVSGILRIAEDQARAAGAGVVNAIELDVGDLAGIELDSLQFCFHSARKGTMADQAELVVNQIPALGHCPECGRDVPLEFPLGACPECGQAVVEAFQGRELRVKSINVD